MPRSKDDPGKGYYWTIDESADPQPEFITTRGRRNRRFSVWIAHWLGSLGCCSMSGLVKVMEDPNFQSASVSSPFGAEAPHVNPALLHLLPVENLHSSTSSNGSRGRCNTASVCGPYSVAPNEDARLHSSLSSQVCMCSSIVSLSVVLHFILFSVCQGSLPSSFRLIDQSGCDVSDSFKQLYKGVFGTPLSKNDEMKFLLILVLMRLHIVQI